MRVTARSFVFCFQGMLKTCQTGMHLTFEVISIRNTKLAIQYTLTKTGSFFAITEVLADLTCIVAVIKDFQASPIPRRGVWPEVIQGGQGVTIPSEIQNWNFWES